MAVVLAALGCAAGSADVSLEALGREAARGTYPKWATGVASYWTAVGADGDDAEALVNEEGMVEVAAGRFSLEPFVELDGRLVTWADVACTQSLVGGDLPLPVVTWHHPAFTLVVTAVADGTPGASLLWLHYRLTPAAGEARRLALRLAVRPFQVLPPWQDLNVTGGAGRIDEIELRDGVLRVDDRRIASAPAAAGLGAPPWTPPAGEPAALRSWVLWWPDGVTDVDVVAPLHDGTAPAPAPGEGVRVRARVAAAWRGRLGRVGIGLPPAAREVASAVRATLGWILTLRDGPAIRPGPRNYARSWIRDGAFTARALLGFGHATEVRDFLAWYAGFQLPDGRVPCCVDGRGADPTPENDSDGELIHAAAEHWRFTGDREALARLWPHVDRAAAHVEALRRERTGPPFAGTAMAGLVPDSISHEGYAKRAVHSYWDDLFALAGLADATELAADVGDAARAAALAAERDGLGRALAASVRRVIADHGIDHLPASVELADFDPTSTAIAVTVAEAEGLLPADALARTFGRYADEVARWRAGEPARDAYTPYEARNAEALVRLGRRDEAARVLAFVMDGRRPAGWHVWPEVIATDPVAPRFLGDMPHGWGGATVVQAVRTMLAYERIRDEALVVAAGVPDAWLAGDPGGVAVRDLPTHWGLLGYRLRRTGPRRVRMDLDAGVRIPPGGIVVAPPLRAPLARARVNGEVVRAGADGTVVVRRMPARVEMEERP